MQARSKSRVASRPGRPHPGPLPPSGGKGEGARGAILLEVVLALAIFVAAAGAIIASLSASVSAAKRLRLEADAADLAVSVLSQVQAGIVEPVETPATPFDWPGTEEWTWRLAVAPAEPGEAALRRVEVVVSNAERRYTYRLAQLMIDPAALPAAEALP